MWWNQSEIKDEKEFLTVVSQSQSTTVLPTKEETGLDGGGESHEMFQSLREKVLCNRREPKELVVCKD